MLDPLKPLDAIPITHGMKVVKVDPDAKYIVFITNEIDIEAFVCDPSNPIPAGTPVYVVEDIDRAVKIYQILDTRVTHGN